MATQSVKPQIGVIGGTGPYAGLDLVKKIFDHTAARSDQDHLPVALLSLPAAIPDRTQYLLGRGDTNPGAGIAEVALQLERMGVRVAAIPCSTAHAENIFEPVLRTLREAHCELKMLHLIGETVRFLQMEYSLQQRIGVLSTTGTFRTRLYARPLEEAGYRVVVPTSQIQEDILHPAIYHPEVGIKAQSSPVTRQARQWVEEAIGSLITGGADVIVLGCSELPLAIPGTAFYGVPLVDPTTVLARALIREVSPHKLKPWC